MLKMTRVLLAIGVAVTLAYATSAFADAGMWAKWKAKTIKADLVQSYQGDDGTLGVPNTPNADPTSSKCIFQKGKAILKMGKDTKIILKGVECNGQLFTGSLCAHTKALSTIASHEYDELGNGTAVNCYSDPNETQDLAGTTTYASGAVGTVLCSKPGKCKGFLGTVTTDPCPAVDKISMLREVEVFDDDVIGGKFISGATLKSCCGPGEVMAGPIGVAAADEDGEGNPSPGICSSGDGLAQRPFAAMGTYNVGQ
jgi:hypothetical protein